MLRPEGSTLPRGNILTDLSDSHTHLEEYSPEELPQVIQRAREAGVGRIITAGSTIESSRAAIGIAESHQNIYAGVGIHPMEVTEALTDETMHQLRRLATSSDKVLVVSEPGLDYLKGKAPKELQQQMFREHIRLARELQLAVIFHCREAYWDCLRILREEHAYEVGAVMHYFVGDQRIAEASIDLGIYISLATPILYLPHLQKIAQNIPMEYMVLETDSFPQPWKKSPLEPAQVRQVAEKVAELRGLSLEEVAAQTTANLKNLVGPRLQ